jgi:hypothetical protein
MTDNSHIPQSKPSSFPPMTTAQDEKRSNPGEARFSAPVQTGPGAHPAFCTMCSGVFPRAKRPGRGVDHSTLSSAEVKGRIELYFCSLLGLSGLF